MSLMSTRSNQLLKLLIRHHLKRDFSKCTSAARHLSNIKNRLKKQNFEATLFENERFHRKWEVTSYRCFADFPDHKKVPLPALSPTMERGTLVSWAKKEGDKLNEGDLLAEIETDKATMGFETPEEGYLAKIIIPAGTKDIPVGKLVCIIVENKEDVAKFKDFKDDGPAVAAKPAAPAPAPPAPAAPAAAAPPAAPPAPPREAVPLTEKGRIYASPMAKNLAAKKGIRLEEVQKGSGLFGSITSKDLEGVQPSFGAGAAAPGAAAKAPPAPGASYQDIPVSNIRTVIAKRLLESKQTIPHYYLTQDICVDELSKLRSKLNKEIEKQKVKISVNDFVIKATAMASRKVPEANSYWLGNVIRQFDNVDVSVAVSTDRGLITPIIFHADRKGLIEISQDMKKLAAKARDGKLQPHEFQGGTISVSNLGMFGLTQFCAIINPPQSCIIAVGSTQDRIVPVNGEPVHKQFMTVTLSCDHRVIDGAVGAQWLKVFKEMIESPVKMLL